MRTGDGAYIRKLNRSLILQEIIKNGKISRAELSKTTGLNKATISVQVADLLEEELIYESREKHNAIGRRPIMLSINGSAGYVLGIDLDTPYIQFAVTNLSGTIVEELTLRIEPEQYDNIVQLLIKQINSYMEKYGDSIYGLTSVNIAVHGAVNNHEIIDFIPKFKWNNKDLKADLMNHLDIEVTVENNANLSVYAEKVFNHQSDNLLTLILTSGIGTGIIINGELHKGYSGYAGEIGHMILEPNGKPCPCGNNGCWERYASEPTVLRELANLLNKPSLSNNEVRDLITNQDPTVIEYLDQFFEYLAIGLNNTINLYNPETIVLNSEILRFYPNAIEKIEQHLQSSMIHYREIVLSQLGRKSGVLGACMVGISNFLDVTELTLSNSTNDNAELNEETVHS